MQRRPFLIGVGGLWLLSAPCVWSADKTAKKCLPAKDAGVWFSVTWDGATGFEGDTYCKQADPGASASRHFKSMGWYVNEQGQTEKDNGWTTVQLSNTDSSSMRIRVLFSNRGDGSIFSSAGDVITAYTAKYGDQESHWTHSGNLVHP
jgi:hypothetical protein